MGSLWKLPYFLQRRQSDRGLPQKREPGSVLLGTLRGVGLGETNGHCHAVAFPPLLRQISRDGGITGWAGGIAILALEVRCEEISVYTFAREMGIWLAKFDGRARGRSFFRFDEKPPLETCGVAPQRSGRIQTARTCWRSVFCVLFFSRANNQK